MATISVRALCGDGGGGLHVEDSDLPNGREINLLHDDLPDDLADQAVTWSFVASGDEGVLVGSKF